MVCKQRCWWPAEMGLLDQTSPGSKPGPVKWLPCLRSRGNVVVSWSAQLGDQRKDEGLASNTCSWHRSKGWISPKRKDCPISSGIRWTTFQSSLLWEAACFRFGWVFNGQLKTSESNLLSQKCSFSFGRMLRRKACSCLSKALFNLTFSVLIHFDTEIN